MFSFIRDFEDSWFGPWKYLFLGDWSDSKHLDLVQKKLVDDLKSKYKVSVPESVLKVIVGGVNYACQREECVSQIILNKGCYVGGIGDRHSESSKLLSKNCDGIKRVSQSIFKLINETANDVEEREFANRQPIILVLDFEVQVSFFIPWLISSHANLTVTT